MDKTWPGWVDPLGTPYSPGDLVAYAGMSGQRAKLNFGEVIRINRINSSGQEIRKGGEPSCSITIQRIDPKKGEILKGNSWQRKKDGNARLVTVLRDDLVVAIRTTPVDIESTVTGLLELHEKLI